MRFLYPVSEIRCTYITAGLNRLHIYINTITFSGLIGMKTEYNIGKDLHE